MNLIIDRKKLVELWPADPYYVRVNSPGMEEWQIDFDQPFALIGSNDNCHIKLALRRLPPLVYLVVAFEGSIEIWPLCAVAFPSWGVMPTTQELRIGQTRLKFSPQQNSKTNSNPQTPATELVQSRILEFEFGGKKGSFGLDRRVLIIGNEHPSTRRLRGAGLTACNFAVVSDNDQCWVIDLNPQTKAKPTAVLLPIGGPSIQFANLRLSCRWPSDEELKKDNEVERESSGSIVAQPAPQPAGYSVGIGSDPDETSWDEIDDVTSVVTDRLVEFRSRGWFRRGLRLTFIVLLFVSAIAALIWIGVEKLWPVLNEIQGWHQ